MNPATVTPSDAGPATPAARSSPVGRHTLGEMVLGAAQRNSGVALQFKRDGASAYISYPELGAIATETARGLIGLGIEPGDRIAILGLTSADWTLADCGSLVAGAVVTPIYHTNSPLECAHVLENSGARAVFCEDAIQAAKIEKIRDRCPALEHVILFQSTGKDDLTLDRLREEGSTVRPEAVNERLRQVGPDDLATLVYTSGTTGPPKGCMLSHENFLSTVRMYSQELRFENTASMYQFLPLAHVLARVAQMVALGVGARIIYWTGDPTKIVDDLGETGPTHFPAVPRIYEKLHAVIAGRMADGPEIQRRLFEWALSAGRRTRPYLRGRRQPPLVNDLQYRLADRLLLSKIRKAFGPNLEMALVGAAPVAKELLEFFDACGVLVLEGYGLTESCAASTLNVPDAVRFGTVGRPLAGTEVTIAPDDEIMIRGPHVFRGYFNNPEATEEVLTPDGWLHSGDLGAIDAQGFVTITGRKKDLIITSSGKNISPVNIESELRDARHITEAVVYGDRRPYLVAILTLDRDGAAGLANRLGIAGDPATVAADPRVHAEIQRDVDAVNAKFARIEQIKRFAILDHDLTQADGELTPTLKVKRALVYEKYADIFDRLYENGAGHD